MRSSFVYCQQLTIVRLQHKYALRLNSLINLKLTRTAKGSSLIYSIITPSLIVALVWIEWERTSRELTNVNEWKAQWNATRKAQSQCVLFYGRRTIVSFQQYYFSNFKNSTPCNFQNPFIYFFFAESQSQWIPHCLSCSCWSFSSRCSVDS